MDCSESALESKARVHISTEWKTKVFKTKFDRQLISNFEPTAIFNSCMVPRYGSLSSQLSSSKQRAASTAHWTT